MKKSLRYFLFLLSFIEGASVMACELFGAKLIAPYFGGSLYVWAAVLGVTLFALMCGYYLGGYLSERRGQTKTIYVVLITGGLFMNLMPYLAHRVMPMCLDMSVQWGTTLSLLVFLLPPLMLMGMTSPLIINTLNREQETAGKTTGSVYAISTFGGIVATFLVGFFLLPEYGIKWPSFVFGSLLITLSAIGILAGKNKSLPLLAIGALVFSGYVNYKSPLINPAYEIVYESEGILGQIKVVDMPYYTSTRGVKKGRALMVNNTAQTILDLDNPEYDLWDWSYYFPAAVSMYPQGSKVLLLGLGGGTLVQQFQRLNFNVDVVELDERIRDIAIRYFNIDPATNVIIDDARHFINQCEEKYDIVTLDLFLNETPPGHVLTVECFERIRGLLNPGGVVMMNFYGFISGEKGLASRCIFKTFLAAGYQVEILATPGTEEGRNLIFLAHDQPIDFDQVAYSENELPELTDIRQYFLDSDQISLEDAIVLTDEIPALEKIYLPAALNWRKSSIDYNLKPLLGLQW